MTRIASVILLLYHILPGMGSSQTVPEGFSLLTVNSELASDATGFALLPDRRVLVVHQFSGQVKLIVNGILKSQALLTVPDLQTSSEKGLLGIAVDPDFPDSPYIYLFHTHSSSTNRVSRFTVGGDLQDPNSDNLTIDVASQQTLIDDMPATNFNHNGGTLRFASDKTLYVSHGDDATTSLVQDLTTLGGKILRINRDGTVPSDNPTFPNEPPGKRPEIFCFGLRNPFRFSIDPTTDELFIGDVGAGSVEEFDLAVGGENFGWPRYEGTADFSTQANLIQPDPTFPIWEYSQLPGSNSAIALLAYRQKDYPFDASFPPEYDGAYFYADFYHDWIRNIRPNGSGGWISVDFGSGFSSPVDGALGPDGSFYLLEYGQELLKIEYSPVIPVELSSFAAQVINGKVMLTWITASETDNFGFEVQRRFDDEKSFQSIAFVQGHGTTAMEHVYHFEDTELPGKTIYYRLKQIDLDGSFKFSEIKMVNNAPPDELILNQNYPNPFNLSTVIPFKLPRHQADDSAALRAVLTIYDISGREVKILLDEKKAPGDYEAQWDGLDVAGNLVSSGIYICTLSYGGLRQSSKLLLVK